MPSTSAPPSRRKSVAPPPQPQGRDAVRAAIIASARELFSTKGYAAVGVREIASHAGVNHGLVHRHFGSKEEVLRAVLQGMFSDVGALANSSLKPGSPDFIEKLYPLAAARKQDWQILMRAVLDGFDFTAAGFEFPITGAVMGHTAVRRGKRDREARIRAGAIIGGGLGWLLLETYLSPVLGLAGEDVDKLRYRMGQLYQTLTDC